jgi:CTP synthase
MNILHIEDDKKQRERVNNTLSEAFRALIIACDFGEHDQYLKSYNIDLIILDLSKDQTRNTEPGDAILENIWAQSFCPIIIFSAFVDSGYNHSHSGNCFIKTVLKGSGDTKQLISAINELLKFIEHRKEIARLLNFHISETYKTIFPAVLNILSSSDTRQSHDVFNRLMRRRIAAAIDETIDFSPLKAWEMYLYPPVGKQILTGDILHKQSEDKNRPESYRVILSPSCDLQNDEARERKPLQKILVATCVSIQQYLYTKEIKTDIPKELFSASLSENLSNTSTGRYMPLPGMEDLLPHMACDFKKLEMIEYENIGEGKEYFRVASIDSPFREAIVWGYMQIACRPGLPDRNFDLWAQQIWDMINPEGTSS